jgi:UTP:GlnB (protein PII) uridylyltransferase
MTLDRAPLLADRSSTGREWCERYATLVDEWLAGLFRAASSSRSGVALVAVGQ